MYGWLTAGITALVMTGLLVLAEKRIDRLHEKNAQLKLDVATAIEANEITNETLRVCTEVNQANADARDSALRKAEQAEGRVNVLAQMLEDSVRDYEPTDENCRTFTDPLPDSFRDSLCIDANCGDPG